MPIEHFVMQYTSHIAFKTFGFATCKARGSEASRRLSGRVTLLETQLNQKSNVLNHSMEHFFQTVLESGCG